MRLWEIRHLWVDRESLPLLDRSIVIFLLNGSLLGKKAVRIYAHISFFVHANS